MVVMVQIQLFIAKQQEVAVMEAEQTHLQMEEQVEPLTETEEEQVDLALEVLEIRLEILVGMEAELMNLEGEEQALGLMEVLGLETMVEMEEMVQQVLLQEVRQILAQGEADLDGSQGLLLQEEMGRLESAWFALNFNN